MNVIIIFFASRDRLSWNLNFPWADILLSNAFHSNYFDFFNPISFHSNKNRKKHPSKLNCCVHSTILHYEYALYIASLPSSVERVGEAFAFPNEYPGQNYEFNWTLNADGVTPLKKSAFRITKPLELKIAGLSPLTKTPLQVKASASKKTLKEAGSDQLSYEDYDEITQRTKDLLSLSDTLYCPEGHMPGTLTSVRVITNSDALAPKLLAFLERAPKRESAGCSITAYVLEDESMESFASFAIEEVGEGEDVNSVAAVVCTGKQVKVEQIVAGLELSLAGLIEDEEARKKEAEEAAQKTSEGEN